VTENHDHEEVKTPWTFKLMIVLVVIYLGWRLIEVLIWLWNAVFN
jgi:hypothetical protein